MVMREAKSIFDCRERREKQRHMHQRGALWALGTEKAKTPFAECSKKRRFRTTTFPGEACGPTFNQYATECSCAVVPTWMERNQSCSTIQRRPKRRATAPRMPVAPVIWRAPAAPSASSDPLPLLPPPELPLVLPSGLSEPVPSGSDSSPRQV